MKGLWIARSLPFPMNTGDRIYSAELMRSVARAGAQLTVVGFAPEEPGVVPVDWPMSMQAVPGKPHGTLRALLSAMPLVAAAHATPAFRHRIDELASEDWDFVVFDQYAMGWAIAPFLRRRGAGRRPLLVHVAHDHEASVYASLVRGLQGSTVKRVGLWQNWLKTMALERRIARSVDLLTAITPQDAELFRRDANGTAIVVMTPGYAGRAAPPRADIACAPRNVLMVGNYRWVAKAENLRKFVAAADAAFHAHDITLHVVGSMPDGLAEELRRQARATVLHGFVDDLEPLMANARIAAVPEEIGGGFKLKFLDFAFGRVPVATLDGVTAGLPMELRDALVCRPTLKALVQAIVEVVDDDVRLNAMRDAAFEAAQRRFDWADRGRELMSAVVALRSKDRESLPPTAALVNEVADA